MTYPPENPPEQASLPVSEDLNAAAYPGGEYSDAADPGAGAAGTPIPAGVAEPGVSSPISQPQPEVETSAPAAPVEPQPSTPDAAEPKRKGGMGEDPAKARQHPLPDPPPVSGTGPAVVLAVCNQKGGVGKTTSTINLGASLAEFGRRVLLVDFDPQGALSVGLGIAPHDLDITVYNLLLDRSTNPQDVVLRTSVKGLDLLPANIDLSAAEIQLVNEVAREQTLERVLRPLLPQYDYILVDCQPSLGLLTVNALTAARGVLIPLECEYFSLRGVALLIDTVEKVRDRLNPDLELEGILATMYDPRTIHAREVFTRIVDAFGDTVFQTTINRTVRFPETTVAGQPITSWAPTSPAAEAYRNLAREILARDAERS
ncbi:AAA family ATPase [Epidermidibacterium keratini]|uniref:AAA family ATPase n=1 Tax=Epidermidibacterium keratini TaxID=1891644 RepID=A0A7L4YJ03_9ACTN|nr:ParA family protein [Epidermidibacterium keratini]QHB98922.1 AAA family ATPase [Epidermidibacterium keratini]